MGFITDLNECTDPVSGDHLIIADASASASDRDRRVNISRFAILANPNTFTNENSFIPGATSQRGAIFDMPSGTSVEAWSVRFSGTQYSRALVSSNDNLIEIGTYDNGSSFGPRFILGRNSNASTPAAGHLRIQNRGGTAYRIWPDNTGVLRIHTADPTNANDTAGTVVGAQTSMAEAKHIESELSSLAEVAARVRAGAEAVRRFVYRSAAYNGERFEGVITDLSPAYGMDRDADHPQGKALNEIQIIGDLLRMVADLVGRVEALEAR